MLNLRLNYTKDSKAENDGRARQFYRNYYFKETK